MGTRVVTCLIQILPFASNNFRVNLRDDQRFFV